VAKQYSGTRGRVDNCQIRVTPQAALEENVYVIDSELYLPDSWGKHAQRCPRWSTPKKVGHQPKRQLAMAMLRQAHP
jgi:SRSO17 transposase